MRDAAEKALRYTQGSPRQDLESDELLRLAVTKLVKIVGEAAKQISEPTRAAHPLRRRRIPVPLPESNARRPASREETAVSKLDQMIATRKAESPRFADAFDRAWHEIEATNEFMSAIADILEQRGLSKAELARRIDRHPSAVRKLFLDGANPTLDTALHVLHALGLEMIVTEAADKRATADV